MKLFQKRSNKKCDVPQFCSHCGKRLQIRTAFLEFDECTGVQNARLYLSCPDFGKKWESLSLKVARTYDPKNNVLIDTTVNYYEELVDYLK